MLPLRWTQLTTPEALPVSLTEAKSHLRITSTDQDTYISSLIAMVVDMVESLSNRAFINRSVSAMFSGFPCENDYLLLPGYPVNAVTGITYIDGNGDTQTLDDDVYRTITGDGGRVLLAFGKIWPTIASSQYGPVTVTFNAGYGDSSADVPAKTKLFILQCLSDAFEHTEAQSEIALAENFMSRELFNSIRVPTVG